MNEIAAPSAAVPERTAWTPDGEVPAATVASGPHADDGRPSEDAIIEACASVYDPEIPVNIYELGLIYAIETDDEHRVKVEMTLTAPGCPSAQELPEQVRQAVLAVDRVNACDVEVVWDPPWDPSRMTEDARLALNMF